MMIASCIVLLVIGLGAWYFWHKKRDGYAEYVKDLESFERMDLQSPGDDSFVRGAAKVRGPSVQQPPPSHIPHGITA